MSNLLNSKEGITCCICSEKYYRMVLMETCLEEFKDLSLAQILLNFNFLSISDFSKLHGSVCFICVAKIQSCFEFKILCQQVDNALNTPNYSASSEILLSDNIPIEVIEENEKRSYEKNTSNSNNNNNVESLSWEPRANNLTIKTEFDELMEIKSENIQKEVIEENETKSYEKKSISSNNNNNTEFLSWEPTVNNLTIKIEFDEKMEIKSGNIQKEIIEENETRSYEKNPVISNNNNNTESLSWESTVNNLTIKTEFVEQMEIKEEETSEDNLSNNYDYGKFYLDEMSMSKDNFVPEENPIPSLEYKNQKSTSSRYKKKKARKGLKKGSKKYSKKQITYACPVCEKTFTSKQTFQEHYLCHNDVKPFACNICNITFNKFEFLEEHQLTHENETKNTAYVCNICNKTFTSYNNLSRHMIIQHRKIEDNKVIDCGNTLNELDKSAKKKLIDSAQKTKKRKKENICNICDKLFTYPRSLALHKLNHTVYKPFVCEICDKTFHEVRFYNAHMFAHSKENTYACDVCTQSFVKSKELVNHKKFFHDDKRPFACNICAKSFNQSRHLKMHKCEFEMDKLLIL